MTHTMTLIESHEGTDVFYCPICDRKLLIEWNPPNRVVIEAGDEYAEHTAGRGLLIDVGVNHDD